MAQPLCTRAPSDSIWKDLSEDDFRKNIIALLRRGGQPISAGSTPHTLAGSKPGYRPSTKAAFVRKISLGTERSLANDFAFLVAAEEGAQNVAACCIEEHLENRTLVVRLGQNHGVCHKVLANIQRICQVLQQELTGGKTVCVFCAVTLTVGHSH
jgi:hypothetical protein